MKKASKLTLGLAAMLFAGVASAQVTLYGQEGLRGRAFTAGGTIENLQGTGFNDRASSMVVQRGEWEICEESYFRGECRIVRPGSYPSLDAMGIGNEISSLRPLRGTPRYAYAPAPVAPAYNYAPRHGERTFMADVISVRAVVGTPEQRCWVERERIGGYTDRNIGGAIVGGIIGGVLGHQIGSGRGQDIATAAGAVTGAAIGSNVAGGAPGYSQDVQRCETVSSGMQPQYWDVVYVFNGQQHRAQFVSPPGPTIVVNEFGEPRA